MRYTRKRQKKGLRHRQKGGKSMAVNLPEAQFKTLLPVSFHRPVDGGPFTIQQATPPPKFSWDVMPRTGTYYSYICFDPDSSVPSWIHLLVVNCTTNDINSGVDLLPWQPPSPPSGTHRYIFGLYIHTYPVAKKEIKDRGSFNVKEYIEKNGFKPVAGAYMKVSATTTT